LEGSLIVTEEEIKKEVDLAIEVIQKNSYEEAFAYCKQFYIGRLDRADSTLRRIKVGLTHAKSQDLDIHREEIITMIEEYFKQYEDEV
jgi:hypothetical protein